MTAPTPPIRMLMLVRDLRRCAACGSGYRLEAQHRQAVGMGGSKRKPNLVQLLTLCSRCNTAVEAEMQRDALRFGWKCRSWVEHAGRVPVYYVAERCWFRLTLDGVRVRILQAEAMEMMRDVYGDQWDAMNLGRTR